MKEFFDWIGEHPCTTGALLLAVIGAVICLATIWLSVSKKISEQDKDNFLQFGALGLIGAFVLFVGIGLGSVDPQGERHKRDMEREKLRLEYGKKS